MEMKNKVKKGKKIMAIMLVLLTFIGSLSNVFAASGTGNWKGYQYSTFLKTTDTLQYGITARSLINTGTGESHTVFCSELGVDFDNGVVYNGSYYTPTNEVMKKACKIAYFGWYSKYGDWTVNERIRDNGMEQYRQDYAFTQQFIWEAMGSNATFVDSNVQAQYVNFKNNINNQINVFKQRPSFDSTTIEVEAGETKVITDTNGVFKNYNSINTSKDGVGFSHNKGENTLTISVPESFEGETVSITDDITRSWNLIKEGTEDHDTSIYFDLNGGGQDQLIALNYNDPTSLAMKVKVDSLGNLELSKLNTKNELVDGAVFTVTGPGYNGDVKVTGGKITLQKIKKGTYTIKEKTAPYGYLVDTQTYSVEVKPNQTATQAIVNKEPTGNFELVKKNATKTKNLQGAEYRVWGDNYDKTFTTDSNGKISVTGLKLGKYNYQETKAPDGFLLDNTIYSFELKYKDQTTSVISVSVERTNSEPTGNFELVKKNATKTKNLKGAEYRVWGDNYDKTFTTDSNGKISVTGLKLGKYNYQETKAPDGFLLDNTIYSFELKYKDQTTSVVSVSVERTNSEPTGNFELVKKNSTKTANLKGAEYRIWNSEYDKTFTTDSNGKILVTDLKLGKYNYQEVKAPDGYLIDNTTYSFELKYKDQTTPVVSVSTEKTNDEPFGEITIKKEDKELKNATRVDGTIHHGDVNIAGAEYTLYADEDIYNKSKTTRYFTKDEEIAKFTFNESGVVTIKIINTKADLKINGSTLANIPLGNYYTKETKAPKGYILDAEKHTLILSYKDSKTKTISVNENVTNSVQKAKFEVIKISGKDSKTAKVVEGAEFTAILTKYVKYYGSFDEALKHLDEYSKDEYAVFTTDKTGHGVSNLLAYGDYTVNETIIPSPEMNKVEEFYVTIDKNSDGVIKELVENDTPFESYLKIIKVDQKTGKKITFSNATFKLYKLNRDTNEWEETSCKIGKERTFTWTTDENAVAYTEDKIEAGTYKIDEIKVPTGFVKLEEDCIFDINNQNKTLEYDKEFDAYITVTIGNEQPTANITIKKTIELVKDADLSLVDVTDLSGIKFKLTAKETIRDMADGSVIYKKGAVVGTFNLNKDGSLNIKNLPLGVYEIQEIETLKGLVLDNIKHEITLKQKDTTTTVYNHTENIVNKTTITEFSKTDITGDKELEGATLQVVDVKNGNIIDEWVSGKKSHKIEGLETGKTYKLIETIAPEGYTKSTEIEFKVENTNEIQKVTMIDKVVEMSKVDIGGEEIEGAKIQVFDGDKNIIDEWVSTKESHKIKNLEEGKKYTLHEEVVADGFVKATDVEFEVTTDKETQHIEMVDKIVEMSKVDIGGEEIEGAKIQVFDGDKNIIDEWVSTKESHKIKNLEEGKKYTLHEEVVADGFVKATDAEFEVTTDKETQHIEMVDKIVEITKTDITNEKEIENAKLQVVDKDNNIIDEWTSTKEAHKVKGLEEGKKYTLIEITAPYGYEIAESIEFEVTYDKATQHIVMKDKPILKNVKLVKIDEETKEVIKDKFTFGIYEDEECTKLIQKIESNTDDGIIVFENLRYGIYFIKELQAPADYEISERVVKVEINDKGVFIDNVETEEKDEAYSFEFTNKKIEVPQTGDIGNKKFILGTLLLALLGLALIVIRVYKDSKKDK
ncbi:MAG: hypothetical protein IJ690_06355 [Clostridia bacterium]|nr:hypothetical protein [Clostridia bacterium]